MLRVSLVLLAVVACSKVSDDHASPAPAPAPPAVAKPEPAKPDPWKTPDKPAAPPPDTGELDLMANHARVEKICPKVTAPYFYRIEKNGKVSHILGTRHMSVGFDKMPKVVHDKLAQAKLAVFETPPDDDHPTNDKSGPALSAQLGPKLWGHYRELVGKMLADNVEHAKPAGAMMMMIAFYEDISQTLDIDIERAAAQAKIPTRGLETNSFQDKLLDHIMDFRMFKASVENTKDRAEIADESRDDLGRYCAGTDKDPGLDERTRKQLHAAGYTDAELDKIDDELVYARNRDWIPKLEKILGPGNVFIAVGADHLIGAKGVVALLQARGYTITRVAP